MKHEKYDKQIVAEWFLSDFLPAPTFEYQFHPTRRWRFDLAWPEKKIALEVEGGSFGRVVVCNRCFQKVSRVTKEGRVVLVREGGRHNTGAGMKADMEKYNTAAVLGWRVFRCEPKELCMAETRDLIRQALQGESWTKSMQRSS